MAKFIFNPLYVEAHRWYKNGDHPLDDSKWIYPDEVTSGVKPSEPFLSEGKIVRRHRLPGQSGNESCPYCSGQMGLHGWIDTSGGGYSVCPGDWIVEHPSKVFSTCDPKLFAKTYLEVKE